MVLKQNRKWLKGFTTLALTVSLFSLTPNPSLAAEGGWIEGEGYWIANSSDSLSIMSSTPDDHWATFEYEDKSSYVAERVTAHTEWSGEYHYSRARYESDIFSVEGDSGRVWDWDSTTATSGWVDPDFTTAHTYWGN